jgi:hypothetical protein
MASITLQMPRAFGKKMMSELIVEAMANAWNDCVLSLWDEGCLSDREKDYYIENNPYKEDT